MPLAFWVSAGHLRVLMVSIDNYCQFKLHIFIAQHLFNVVSNLMNVSMHRSGSINDEADLFNFTEASHRISIFQFIPSKFNSGI